jgi:hypothetical protein
VGVGVNWGLQTGPMPSIELVRRVRVIG